MPKKRKTSWAHTKKQKQIITTRLIEISIKVDDHVYTHKPITESAAEDYLSEVASYRTQCAGDERSLQVIEKLTRCMKALIKEYQELRGESFNTNYASPIPLDNNTNREKSVSPVYSLSEEDRTQLMQLSQNRLRIDSAGNGRLLKDNIAIIDPCDDNDDDEITDSALKKDSNAKINVEIDIHRAISNLSISEVDPYEIKSSNVYASQNIHNHFEGIDSLQHNKIESTPKSNIFKETMSNKNAVKSTYSYKTSNELSTIPNVNNVNELQSNASSFIVKPKKTTNMRNKNRADIETISLKDKTEQNTEHTKPIKNTEYMTSDSGLNQLTKECYIIRNNQTAVTQEGTRFNTKKISTMNNNNLILEHSVNDFSRPAKSCNERTISIGIKKSAIYNVDTLQNKLSDVQIESPTVKANETKKPKVIHDKVTHNTTINQNSTTIKKKRPRQKKTEQVKKNQTKNKTIKARNPQSFLKDKSFTNFAKIDSNVPIYNTNVENDLSWLENIRYVREIRPDENDTKLNLEESFWDNYYFPANLIENDFL